jgi:hypothetical protein
MSATETATPETSALVRDLTFKIDCGQARLRDLIKDRNRYVQAHCPYSKRLSLKVAKEHPAFLTEHPGLLKLQVAIYDQTAAIRGWRERLDEYQKRLKAA